MTDMLNSLNLQKPIFENIQDHNNEDGNNNKINDDKKNNTSKLRDNYLDHTSIKNMLHVWVYKLLNNLDEENRDLLKFFDLPKHPKSDEDYFKLITSLKIIEHCSSSVEFSSIWLLIISLFLMWFLRTAGKLIGNYFVEEVNISTWSENIEKKLEEKSYSLFR